MAIKIACPHCDQVHTLSDTQEGKTIRCKSCDEKFVVRRPRSSRRRADDDEADRPTRRGGKGAVPLWAWLAGGGGLLLILLVVVIVVVSKGKSGSKSGDKSNTGNSGASANTPLGIPGGNAPPAALTVENFKKVRYGMTREELVEFFGPPSLESGDITSVAGGVLSWAKGNIRLSAGMGRGRLGWANLSKDGTTSLADLPLRQGGN